MLMKGSIIPDDARDIDKEGIVAGVLAKDDIVEIARNCDTTPRYVIDAIEVLNTTDPHAFPFAVVSEYYRQYREGGFQRRDRLISSYYFGMKDMPHAGYDIKAFRLDKNCLKIKIGNDCEISSPSAVTASTIRVSAKLLFQP